MSTNPSPCDSCANGPATELSRRSFLQLMAAGLGVVLLNGCGSGETEPPAGPGPRAAANLVEAVPSGNEFKIPGAGKLKNGEGLAYGMNGEAKGIVFKTADGRLKAVTSRCTHAGGTLEWQGGQLHCPSHGSVFDTDGKVVKGPAVKPLDQFKVRAEGADAIVAPV